MRSEYFKMFWLIIFIVLVYQFSKSNVHTVFNAILKTWYFHFSILYCPRSEFIFWRRDSTNSRYLHIHVSVFVRSIVLYGGRRVHYVHKISHGIPRTVHTHKFITVDINQLNAEQQQHSTEKTGPMDKTWLEKESFCLFIWPWDEERKKTTSANTAARKEKKAQ